MRKHPVFTGLLVSLAAILSLASIAAAQPPMQRRSPEGTVAEMDSVLTLSDDQKTRILKIYTDAEANMPRGGGQGGPGGPGGFMMAGGPMDDAVEKVLTDEQATAWRAYTLNQEIDRRIDRIDAAVALTDSQKAQIRPVIETEVTGRRELMAQRRAQDGTPARETIRSRMTELRDATEKSLKTILTTEQLEKYNSLPRRGMRRQ